MVVVVEALPPATAETAHPAAADTRPTAARAAADKLRIDLHSVDGRGPGGAITVGDVERAAARRRVAPPVERGEHVEGDREDLHGQEHGDEIVGRGHEHRLQCDVEWPDLAFAHVDLHGLAGRGIRGHRDVGGYRASLYNALPISSVQVLVDVMRHLESQFA